LLLSRFRISYRFLPVAGDIMSALTLNPPVPPAPASARRRAGRAGVPARDRPARSVPEGARAPDAALLERARGGDAAAFATVYDRHAAAAYGLARRMVHDPAAAQDVVQEAFLSLWRSDGYCPDKGSLRSFVLGIVRNRAIDALRKDRRRRADDRSDQSVVSHLAAADRTDVEVEQRDTERFLRAALTKLPDAQRRALDLAFFGGLTYAEIALRLDEPIGTIKGRIRLGLEKLRCDIDATSCR
jgi:RNA polymerase sigma-70 factor, ECF subfamily